MNLTWSRRCSRWCKHSEHKEVEKTHVSILPRIPRVFFKRVLVIAIALLSALAVPLLAQQSPSFTAHQTTLPDAPCQAQASTQSGEIPPQQESSATLSGTVVDKNGDALQGAELMLSGPAGCPVRTVQSGSNGQFEFTGLHPNVYKLTVSAPGMSTFTLSDIPLRAGEFHFLPPVTLSLSPVITSVTVTPNSKQLSEEQLHIAEQQRVAGIIPNFYSSYNRNAPPMLAKQKFQLSVRSIIDPVTFLTVAGTAGVEQYRNAFPAYGGGIEGYGKRYGAALANHTSGILLGKAVYPSIFHQDPRYLYKGKGSIGSRALYAISATVIARGDNGRWEPNYSNVLGHFSAAAISNLYYPASDRGASLTIVNGLAGIGGGAVSNLLREFILKRFTSHVPKGQTASHSENQTEFRDFHDRQHSRAAIARKMAQTETAQ